MNRAERRRAWSPAGRKQRADVDAMAVFALLAERAYGAEPRVAARAAILAFFTFVDDPHPELQVDPYLGTVQKASQRFKRGKRDLMLPIERIAIQHFRETGERFVATPQEIAASVAAFLPEGQGRRGGRPKKAPTYQEIVARVGDRWLDHWSEGPGAARAWLVKQLAAEREVDERTARRWVEDVYGDDLKQRRKRDP